MENKEIIHEGYIASMNAALIEVNIESKSACASCHASGACHAADQSNRIIQVKNNACYTHLKVGDVVTVQGNFTSGLTAVLFAYVLPFILILLTLILSSAITNNNLVSGILALGITVPYYILLYFYRNRFEKHFSFFIKTAA